MKTSRQRVLDYIRSQRAVTAGEISLALQMTTANARHHLGILEAQGLVVAIGARPQRTRGRPMQVYSPGEQVNGHNLVRLASALLNDLIADAGENTKTVTLKRLAQVMLAPKDDAAGRTNVGDHPPGAAQLTLRLNHAIRWLNGCNYQARWEAHASAPRVILGHCPYFSILESHPELCQLDAYLLEAMLGYSAQQGARLALDTRGAHYCMFRLVKW